MTQGESGTKVEHENDKPVYILITQCLQNGFFLADENRLCLPNEVVKQMLIGQQDAKMNVDKKNQRHYSVDFKSGPLYRFFDSVISPYKKNQVAAELHVIHIKDWHAVSKEYDFERNLYGAHCEAGSWDAEPITGFDNFLKPWGSDEAKTKLARGREGYVEGNVRFYDVRSDSLFDFRPDNTDTIPLDDSFDLIPSASQSKRTHLQLLLDKLIENKKSKGRVYVVLIGVYTDIKVKMLLTGLRTRYDIDNLITCDLLTAAPSLERHLEGLDFAAKVLNVEIIHSLNEVGSVLNPEQDKHAIPQTLTEHTINFRDYRTYFLDKQNILSFQDQRLLEYLNLTSNRSLQVYKSVYSANLFLIICGAIFLGMTILLIATKLLGYDVKPELLLVTGGLGTAQVVATFFTKPSHDMRQNLTALVRLRNYLETYSNVSALLRHHLTLANRLQPNLHDEESYKRANRELDLLERQLKLVEAASTAMTRNFPDLVVGLEQLKQAEVNNSQIAATDTPPPADTPTNTSSSDNPPLVPDVPSAIPPSLPSDPPAAPPTLPEGEAPG